MLILTARGETTKYKRDSRYNNEREHPLKHFATVSFQSGVALPLSTSMLWNSEPHIWQVLAWMPPDKQAHSRIDGKSVEHIHDPLMTLSIASLTKTEVNHTVD